MAGYGLYTILEFIRYGAVPLSCHNCSYNWNSPANDTCSCMLTGKSPDNDSPSCTLEDWQKRVMETA